MTTIASRYNYLIAVKQAIEKNFNHPLNISELAELAGVSESKLQHDFHSAFKMTMQGYQTEIRIDTAKHLLRYSDHFIKNISKEVGYKNPSNFTHAFKKHTGIGPNEYRKG